MEKYDKKIEINNWYSFYLNFNDNNLSHAESAFVSNGLIDVNSYELHKANCKWLQEMIEHGLTPDEICNIMPSASIYSKELCKAYNK